MWRVEFQIRREVLKQFRVESLDDLLACSSAIWLYATCEWLSMRLQDNSNTRRRTVHPWWKAVSECEELLGPESDRTRQRRAATPADLEWYVRRIAGIVPGLAVRAGIIELTEAITAVHDHLHAYWDRNDWADALTKKRVDVASGDGAPDVPI